MRLVDRAPPRTAAIHPLPASPSPLPPPKKPAVKPKPAVKKPKIAKKKPPPKKIPTPSLPQPTPMVTAHEPDPEPAVPRPVTEEQPSASNQTVRPVASPSLIAPRKTDQAPGAKAATVTTVVKARPRYSENPPPAYPSIARKRGYQGTVILEVFVKANGRVGDLRIIESSSHTLLDRTAIKAVNDWRFEPGRQGSRIIPMWVRVPVVFRLQ